MSILPTALFASKKRGILLLLLSYEHVHTKKKRHGGEPIRIPQNPPAPRERNFTAATCVCAARKKTKGANAPYPHDTPALNRIVYRSAVMGLQAFGRGESSCGKTPEVIGG